MNNIMRESEDWNVLTDRESFSSRAVSCPPSCPRLKILQVQKLEKVRRHEGTLKAKIIPLVPVRRYLPLLYDPFYNLIIAHTREK